MEFTLTDLTHLLPIVIVAASVLVAMTIDMFTKEADKTLGWFTALSLFAAAYVSLFFVDKTGVHLSGVVASGGATNILHFVFTFGAGVVALISMEYAKKTEMRVGEYYVLVLSSVLGMMLIAAAKDLAVIFVGLEQMSISFYALAGIRRKRDKSVEASLKYFLLGAFATGFVVYGMALIYGSSGTMALDTIRYAFPDLVSQPLFVLGLALFVIGFAFKIAAVPFHMWAPDVYQGSPTPVAGLMSTVGKAAAFAALLLIFRPVFDGAENALFPFLAVVATLSMLYGAIVAIAQDDLKRMLAYSSVAHAGYMLIGFASGEATGAAGVIYYLVAYTFMNLGAFGIISMIESAEETNLKVRDYAGLGTRAPALAALLSLFMFALSGIPPLAGFFGKYYVFIAAVEGGATWLALVGVASSAISVYFYLRVVVVMYFGKSENRMEYSVSNVSLLGVTISAMLVILLGVLPGSIIKLIESFVR